MKGFNSKFKDFPDYILGITNEIWEKRGIETWDEFLTIIDIVQVSAKPAKADVKIKEGDAVKKSEKAIKKAEQK